MGFDSSIRAADILKKLPPALLLRITAKRPLTMAMLIRLIFKIKLGLQSQDTLKKYFLASSPGFFLTFLSQSIVTFCPSK
ncbi:MAG: hypothetical protein Q7U30_10745, partial [Methylicorpusculum sp.]|nr:hypothetical protein [Methylicorpusculum sp.]